MLVTNKKIMSAATAQKCAVARARQDAAIRKLWQGTIIKE